MSYDVSLVIDTGAGRYATCGSWNYTYNMGYAIRHGGIEVYAPLEREDSAKEPGRFVLDGASAPAAADALADCIAIITRDAHELVEKEPTNGWGSVDGLIEHFLRPLMEACRKHPLGRLVCS